MGKRHFVMLAHDFDEKKHGVAGMFMSEKMDGMRALWDGGITRGLPATEVPWANVERDGRYVTPPKATGLWSRYGNVIHAPDYWLDEMPDHPLDGELWIGRDSWNELMSTVKCLLPPMGWDRVKYCVFDVPAPNVVFADGFIDLPPNYVKRLKGAADWYAGKCGRIMPTFYSFEDAYRYMEREFPERDTHRHLRFHPQELLPFNTPAAQDRVREYLDAVTMGRGEGVILRRPPSIWKPERVYDLLKMKKVSDAEGTVIGYVWGKETDRGSKLMGMMGSLTLRLDSGKVFDLSGFTEKERKMIRAAGQDEDLGDFLDPMKSAAMIEKLEADAVDEGCKNPGQVVPENFFNPNFKRGQRVTFTYREMSPDGKPKEARYWRKRVD